MERSLSKRGRLLDTRHFLDHLRYLTDPNFQTENYVKILGYKTNLRCDDRFEDSFCTINKQI